MATLSQLQAEPWWGREIVTPELDWLGDTICARTGRPRAAAGTKGDVNHLRGAHRSQEWILNSRYCTSRTYTVQSGLSGEQVRHIAGFDFTPGSGAAMLAQCRRLYAAVRDGRLEEVREFYGNVDGDQVVDGWDNVANRAATSDSSHLWHWHLTIDRRRLRDQALMERILATALGTTPTTQEVTMFCRHGERNAQVWVLQRQLNELGAGPIAEDWQYGAETAAAVVRAGITGGDVSGRTYGPGEYAALQTKLREKAARDAVAKLPPPIPGDQLAPGDRLTVSVVSVEPGEAS